MDVLTKFLINFNVISTIVFLIIISIARITDKGILKFNSFSKGLKEDSHYLPFKILIRTLLFLEYCFLCVSVLAYSTSVIMYLALIISLTLIISLYYISLINFLLAIIFLIASKEFIFKKYLDSIFNNSDSNINKLIEKYECIFTDNEVSYFLGDEIHSYLISDNCSEYIINQLLLLDDISSAVPTKILDKKVNDFIFRIQNLILKERKCI